MSLRPWILLSLFLVRPGFALRGDNVPVAPMHAAADADHGEVFTLTARHFRLLVSPRTGEVVSLKFADGVERLTDPIRISALKQPEMHPSPDPWENRAWRTSEGKQVVMLAKSFGPPLSLRVVHVIEVLPERNACRMVSRISATGPGDPELLGPRLSVTLNVDDMPGSEETAVLTGIADGLAAWRHQWHLELPEHPMPSRFDLHFLPGSLSLQSQAALPEDLPPQGWTLRGELHMLFDFPDEAPAATPIILKWPFPLN